MFFSIIPIEDWVTFHGPAREAGCTQIGRRMGVGRLCPNAGFGTAMVAKFRIKCNKHSMNPVARLVLTLLGAPRQQQWYYGVVELTPLNEIQVKPARQKEKNWVTSMEARPDGASTGTPLWQSQPPPQADLVTTGWKQEKVDTRFARLLSIYAGEKLCFPQRAEAIDGFKSMTAQYTDWRQQVHFPGRHLRLRTVLVQSSALLRFLPKQASAATKHLTVDHKRANIPPTYSDTSLCSSML